MRFIKASILTTLYLMNLHLITTNPRVYQPLKDLLK